MRNRTIVLAFILASSSSFAQDGIHNKVIEITPAKEFFEKCQGDLRELERGEFETKEEFEQRSRISVDTSTIWYLSTSEGILASIKPYEYDIDSETLCFKGTERAKEFDSFISNRPKGLLLNLYSELDDQDDYSATNALGATVTVKKTWLHEYGLDIVNYQIIPKQNLNDKRVDSIFEKALSMCIQKPPKEAEILSKNTILVIGVKLRLDSKHYLECTASTKPTFANPTEVTQFTRWVNVDFCNLMLVDKQSGHALKSLPLAVSN